MTDVHHSPCPDPHSPTFFHHSLTKQLNPNPCLVCSRMLRYTISKPAPRAIRSNQVVPEYKVLAYGHTFHAACLYSFLTDVSALNVVVCDEYELIQRHVRCNGWDACEVGEAMDGVEKVTIRIELEGRVIERQRA
jgi:hypothetical protein